VRDDKERLGDIMEAIEKVTTRANQVKETFARDEMLQVWVIYHL